MMEFNKGMSQYFLVSFDFDKNNNGVILLQVDDAITLGTREFHSKFNAAASRFENHGAKFFSPRPTSFNGADLTYDGTSYVID